MSHSGFLPDLLARLPGPQGERFVQALRHGTMSVELYAPQGQDLQQPHAQDELYLVHAGRALLQREGEADLPCEPGVCAFVAAGRMHRFVEISEGFQTWVVFWGPAGGEPSR